MKDYLILLLLTAGMVMLVLFRYFAFDVDQGPAVIQILQSLLESSVVERMPYRVTYKFEPSKDFISGSVFFLV